MMTIKKILENSITREQFHTHVSMGTFKAKYNFSRKNIENFFNNYNAENNSICLAEKPQQYTPILVDIDIKRKIDEINSERTESHITEIIKVYQKVLKEILQDINDKDLTCIFLDKPKYEVIQNKITYVKNGYHLHFPYIFLNRDSQKIHLIPRVKQIVKELNIFHDLGFENSEQLIDDVTSNAWLIYGSSKDENMNSYKISKVYNHNCEEVSLEDGLANYPIYNINEEKIVFKENEITENLPRILSIIPYNRFELVKEIKENLENPNKQEQQQVRRSNKIKHNKNTQQLLEDAKELVKIISKDRAENRKDWLTIGWCLYNISSGSEDGFEIWNEFSSRSTEKYDEAICEYTWSKMKEGTLSIATLHYLAKLDDKKLYLEFVKRNNKNILH